MSFSLPVRRQYIRMGMRAIREGRLGWLAKTGAKTLSVPVSQWLGRPLAGPIMANLIPTYRCNNACFMCDLPKQELYETRANGREEMSTEELKAVIDDLAAIGTVGLSLAGGEPTVRPDVFELLSHASKRGLFPHLNTNGYNLHQPARVEALLETGVESMNFSLDGATAETHNRLRNAEFGFERIARGTELIIKTRRSERPAVTYTFVLGPDNYREVPAFVRLARDRGINSVSFNPLHACYGGATPISAEAQRGLEATVDWIRNQKAREPGDFIDNSDAFLSLFPRSFRGEASPLRCSVTYHHILVDCYGNIYSCTLTYQQRRPAANTHDVSIRDFWGGPEWARSRDELDSCRACYWNCHTELNLLYQSAPGSV